MSNKKTHEKYVEELKTKNPNVVAIEQYKNSYTSIKHKCTICGHEWNARPRSVLGGGECPNCRAIRNGWTTEGYIARANVINPNVKVLGVYVNNATKILHKCLKKECEYEWEARPSDILSGYGCPKCAGNIKCTHEEYVEKVSKINPNIEVIEQYINANTPILHKCKIDSYQWSAPPCRILSGAGCAKCAKNIKPTQEEYVAKVLKINPNIEVVGQYINSSTKIKHKCLLDEHEWLAKPNDILNGHGCPECAHKTKYTHEEYVKMIKNINPNIEVLGKYVKMTTKIKVKCLIDGYEWESMPNYLLKGKGCPVCNHSAIGPAPHYLNSIYASEYKSYFAQYLTEEQMKQFKPKSEQKVIAKCPRCGFLKEIPIYRLLKQGLGCQKCSDGISYPNKFGRAFIEQLDVKNIDYEYNPDWLIINGNKCAYDIYFEYQNKQYVVEMDGGIGHGNSTYKNRKIQDVEGLERDSIKDNLATQHKVNVIRIDCMISDPEYIRKSIMNSSLPNILKFKESDINWKTCDEIATSSFVIKAGNLWNEGLLVREIAEKLKIHYVTATRYLKQCTRIGVCEYSEEIARKRYGKRARGENHVLSKKVIRLKDNKIYESVSAAAKNNPFCANTIIKYCKNHKDFMYYDEWLEINNPV